MISKLLLFGIGVVVGLFGLTIFECRRVADVDSISVRIVNNSGAPCRVFGYVTSLSESPTVQEIGEAETRTVFPWRGPASVVQSLLLLEIETEGRRFVLEVSPEDMAAITERSQPLTIECGRGSIIVSTRGVVHTTVPK